MLLELFLFNINKRTYKLDRHIDLADVSRSTDMRLINCDGSQRALLMRTRTRLGELRQRRTRDEMEVGERFLRDDRYSVTREIRVEKF